MLKKNSTAVWGRFIFALLVVVGLIIALPNGKAFSEETAPQPETTSSHDLILNPTTEENNDMTRGIVWTGLLMVTVVVVGALSILRVDQKNHPHLIRRKKKKAK